MPESLLVGLVCSRCGRFYPGSTIHTYAKCCNQPLLARYNLRQCSFDSMIDLGQPGMWRYRKLLPIVNEGNIISLGEGMTPVYDLNKLAAYFNVSSIKFKDEAYNPTGSFKARGISLAISKARELGIDRFIIPTAGNAGGALAAYCASSAMDCIVVMPKHAPAIFKEECRLYGAQLVLVNGLISDCAKKVEEIRRSKDYFDLSTLREPYRLEGKKTMGYEIAEQLNYQLPDVIVYPAGGGTGLIGIWKAFNEMLQMGWIEEPLPKMVAVQAENCAPLALAIKDASRWMKDFVPKSSVAGGLVVPYPFGMDLMREVIMSSGGDVITVTDESIVNGTREVARVEGILLSPEGSAAWKGVEYLVKQKKVERDSRILFLNTGSGYKYMDHLISTSPQ